ncbi:hypothetical protein K443DRAFT_269910 [Laccaria amethystina LaAM-08-1]|uniref:Uncharacterized protein n=1 Tax=Laccaria amethystina LaAM-08-1 TaxID=1095629 RepID=A0A0C9X6M4_9AGAR|nr:hypothetical protein K443DRAFT_269910 [Laccaria amethystina LaAM-08-1]
MRPPDPLSCDMKDQHDAMQNMVKFRRSSPAQDLADTMSVVCQDGNLKFWSYSLFARPGVPVFKYSATQKLLKFWLTLLVSFIRLRTSWHGRMMSLVAMTRSCRFTAQIRVFKGLIQIDFTIFTSSWCGSHILISPVYLRLHVSFYLPSRLVEV